MDIPGKKAMVVGGASGMGRATAQALAHAGARVAILDREGSDGKDVATSIGGVFHALDITDFGGAEEVIEAAVAELGGLHIAVNTAGGGKVQKTLGRQGPHDLDLFRQVIDLNLVGTFNLNRFQALHMSANEPEDDERGVIVNTSSLAAFEGQIGQVAYAAAKAGIAGSALVMARDLGPLGIRVTAIAPSLFSTGATSKFSDEQVAPLVKDAAFPKRMGRPEEYAKLALAIVDNPMLNGQCIRLDAGQRFGPR
ncbi:SDR family NAD(P)-dependent oxidoreductase [Gordonia sp. ABSL1-1]|uniref:SDR family NAD(P)-dependent oxidoreductase n=1 Tax=Gordonia sp. ABSL1-1 TaxID=3053923 RepID=UPI002573E89C|nr:SDR family NAD(P)-dependent oxidoreductase [Gordonia sp. ABSL1-1]MDL9938070.1 SDR family NAD(P)-dependent oxidoreductase [Gordonia sp. ABSL1-1]